MKKPSLDTSFESSKLEIIEPKMFSLLFDIPSVTMFFFFMIDTIFWACKVSFVVNVV